MWVEIPTRPEIGPTDLLCINRKVHDQPVKPRQAAFVDRFLQGAQAAGQPSHLASFQEAIRYPVSNPWYIRGMKFTAAIDDCWQTGRTFYYTDNGYVGNTQSKMYFRIIKDHVHDTRPIIQRPRDRLDRCRYTLKPKSTGSKILIAPPSSKSFSVWNMNADVWLDETIAEIKKHTDRPIAVRLKRARSERLSVDTMEQALDDDVYCLVTYNSVAAVEAVMLGKPVVTLGPNAARTVGNSSLSQIENLFFPDDDQREMWLRHLSYCQFSFNEMSNGTAWRILNS
jgi:hypothetical protein